MSFHLKNLFTGYRLLFLFTISFNLFNPPNISAQDTLFRPNNYSFELSSVFYGKPNAVILSGNNMLKLYPSVSYQWGFVYSRYWKNGVGFKVGMRSGVVPVFANYAVAQNDLPSQYHGYGNQGGHLRPYDIQYFQFPVEASYRIVLKKNFNLTLSSGIAVELIPPAVAPEYRPYPGQPPYSYYPITSNINTQVFAMDIYKNPGNKVFFNIPFEIMASKVLKNHDAIDFGLCAGLTLQDESSVRYTILPAQSNASQGIFYLRNSYVSVKLSYTIRGTDKILKKNRKKVKGS